MLNDLISPHVENWFQQPDCPARSIVEHIRSRGKLRVPQIEAIKTYLFLKIQGGNRPLYEMFCEGFLSKGLDLSRLHISQQARAVFEADPAARALFEFARGKANGDTEARLPKLEKYLLDNAAHTDCQDVVKRIFYGVDYPDYLFSLPMGAGKTFLMAAFIYLDLYFAQNEPDNKTWAHNFILLVPSGLKSSILPSLKTIENFDATWVLPEPAASNVKKLIRFEVLDQPKSGKKSNKTRSPNAVKVAGHQPFEDLMGLVMVTNAEKVVLDRVELNSQGVLIMDDGDGKKDPANELRGLIGKIPNLQILIDEVHHVVKDNIKLRQVVNNWSKGGSINGVLGFSGTPYDSDAQDVSAAQGVSLKFTQITNTVYYYPLTRAIETFLKRPTVRTLSEVEATAIARRGAKDFREQYGERVYANGTIAKLAIYCGTIERLEEVIHPLLIAEGFAPDEILKYHKGNKDYPAPAGAEAEWRILDTPLSKKRVILLVQIGKEGWDCRSLTGVILSQKGDCPINMVLQTSCRCLREMERNGPDGARETAGIWLNADNAKLLDKQLREEQHTSIEEINNLGRANAPILRPRTGRVDRLRLPPVAFYQMCIEYDMLTLQDAAPQTTIKALDPAQWRSKAEIITSGLETSKHEKRRFLDDEQGEPAHFATWLFHISKGSFGEVSLSDLRALETDIRLIFDAITYDDEGTRRFNALYDQSALAARIRLAFHARRTLHTRSEVFSKEARLLVVEKLHAVAADKKYLYPDEADCARMLTMDASGQTADEYAREQRASYEYAIQVLKAQNLNVGLLAEPDAALTTPLQNKDRAFQYVPYNFDSSFELDFLTQALTFETLRERGLELYFNGEGELTEFRIECFARAAHGWNRVGMYSPDFLIVERRRGGIHRALIVETKGAGFAKDFAPRKKFVETEWLQLNNDKFGYRRFDFLYLEGDMNPETRFDLEQKVRQFFTD